MRRRDQERQGELWVATEALPSGPGHVFYERLNGLLAEAGFDRFVEDLVEEYYSNVGRAGIAPGVYFRMLFVGYFEGIDSQRGIAWRCADSLSLRSFLGLDLTEKSPDHSSMTRIRDRYPIEIADEVFAFLSASDADSEQLLANDHRSISILRKQISLTVCYQSFVGDRKF